MPRGIPKKLPADAVKVVNDYNNPAASLMKIPHKNPTLNYRFVRNTPENIGMMEAQGYEVCNGEAVRQAGLKPREDGSYRNGDLILAAEPMAHHAEHKSLERDLRKRQEEAMKDQRGSRRVGKFNFSEHIQQERGR